MIDRDLHGLQRLYYRPEGAAGTRLRELARAGEPGLGVDLDPVGVAFAFGEIDDASRTWIQGIRRVPRGHRLSGGPGEWQIEPAPPPPESGFGGLERRLLAALDAVVGRGKRVALALT